MGKLIFSVLLSVLSIGNSFAQKSSSGIISYTVPGGYQLVKTDNVLTYFKTDTKTGAYCRFIIYNMLPSRGGRQEDFNFFWNNMLVKSMNVGGTPAMQPAATLKGWQLTMGSSLYKDNGGEYNGHTQHVQRGK